MRWKTLIRAGVTRALRGDPGRGERLMFGALRRATKRGADRLGRATCLKHLAELYDLADRLADAEEFYRKSLEAMAVDRVDPEHPLTLTVLHYLAQVCADRGDPSAADKARERYTALARRFRPSGGPCLMTSTGRGNARGRGLSQMIYLFVDRRILARARIHQGPASDLNLMGQYYEGRGWPAEAEALYRRALRVDRALGPDHPVVLFHLECLSSLLARTGRADEAAGHETQAARIRCRRAEEVKALGGDPGKLAGYLFRQGQLMERAGLYPEAAGLYRKALALEPTDRRTWYFIHNNLGYCRNQVGRFAEGEQLCRKAIAIDPDRSTAHKNLGVAQEGLGLHGKAARAYLRSVEVSRGGDPRGLRHLEKLLESHPELHRVVPDLESRLEACEALVQRAAADRGKRRGGQIAASPACELPATARNEKQR